MPTPKGRHSANEKRAKPNKAGADIAASRLLAAPERSDQESLLRGQKRILESTARGRPLAEVLYETVRFLEERQPGTVCAVMLVDHSTHQLCYAAAPSLPEDLLAATDGLPLDGEIGLCVRAIMLDAPSFLDRTRMDPRLEQYLDLARRHSITGFWAMPSRSSTGEPLGALVVLTRENTAPQPDWNLLSIAADLVSIAVERSRAEEARNVNLFALLENMAEGVVAVDTVGNLIVANPAARRMLGLVSAQHGEPLVSVGLGGSLQEALIRIATREGEKPERLLLRKGPVHLSAYVSPVGNELGSSGALALLRDVTEEVRFQRLQESFLVNVSHELRAPLSLLSAALEAMSDGLIPEEERPRYMQLMLKEMARLRRLSHDVVELTRLEAWAEDAELKEFPLDLVLESLRERFGPRFDKSGVRLIISACALRVRSDYERVEQVLQQLLENAVRFTPEGGTVRLHARAEGRTARILVEDNGIGIPREHLPLIWERFYKVDPARRREPGSGTGLGLAIVRQILRGLGSEVAVESEEGKGSTFHFTLPLAQG